MLRKFFLMPLLRCTIFIKNNSTKLLLLFALATIPAHACRNTISNNTSSTFKVAEIKQHNADLKQALILPDDYVKDEEKARTLKPGEETDFGGHYLPKFIIYKETDQKTWKPILYVRQIRCAPEGSDPSRFPENKYLLMTDLLKCKLPNDYQEVYKFTIKCEPSELNAESINKKTLTKLNNPYQELVVLLDEMTQKIQELFSMVLEKADICTNTNKPKDNIFYNNDDEDESTKKDSKAKESETCPMCLGG